MILKFKTKEHYGRIDFYPANEAARVALEFKRLIGKAEHIKAFKLEELKALENLGHEIELVQELKQIMNERTK